MSSVVGSVFSGIIDSARRRVGHARLAQRGPYVAGAVALVVYIITLAPTVTSEDSGELIGAAYFWGVPHPPGYPLWTMLCGIFIKAIPFGNVAWRANLFSAVCTAVGIGLLCRVLLLFRLHPLAAFGGAVICAFGRVLWSQSVITEVYALHFLVFVLIVWSAMRWWISKENRWLCLGSLLLGLGMSNHQTIGFTGVAVACWVLLQKPQLLLHGRLVIVCILAFLVGLLPHVYMYVRAQADPPVNWGETKTLKALWDHVSRRQYRSSEPADDKTSVSESLRYRAGELRQIGIYAAREFTPVLALLACAGVVTMLRQGRRRVFLLWFLLLSCNALLHMYATRFAFETRLDQWANQVFFLPVFACVAIGVAFALDGLWGLRRRVVAKVSRTWERRLVAGTTACGVLAVAAVPVLANFRYNNMRNYWYAYDHAKNILDTMLPHAIIFPSGDHNTFPLIYLSLVEGYRSDVVIADKYGYIDPGLYADMSDNPGKPRTRAERDRIEEWVIRHARRPVYYTAKKASLVPNATMVQVGILYHLLPDTKSIDTDSVWDGYRYRNLEGLPAPRDFGADNILADWEFFQGVRRLELGHAGEALRHFARAERYAWGIKEILNNIGSALAEHGQVDEAIAYYRKAASMDPRYEAPRWNMARLFKSRRQYEDAARVFEELTKADPDDFRPWGELGFLAARNGDSAKAIRYWNASLKLNPSQPQIIEQLYAYYSRPAQGETASTLPTPHASTQPASHAAELLEFSGE